MNPARVAQLKTKIARLVVWLLVCAFLAGWYGGKDLAEYLQKRAFGEPKEQTR
jgi:hypothetical protein